SIECQWLGRRAKLPPRSIQGQASRLHVRPALAAPGPAPAFAPSSPLLYLGPPHSTLEVPTNSGDPMPQLLRRFRSSAALTLIAVLALFAGSCGGGASQESTTSTPPADTTSPAPAPRAELS